MPRPTFSPDLDRGPPLFGNHGGPIPIPDTSSFLTSFWRNFPCQGPREPHHVKCSLWYSKGTLGITHGWCDRSFLDLPFIYPFWPIMTSSPDYSSGPKSPELHSLEPPDGRIAHTLTACTRCRQVWCHLPVPAISDFSPLCPRASQPFPPLLSRYYFGTDLLFV